MRLISNRGNIEGPNSENENQYAHIVYALNAGFDCKIDVRVHNNKLYVGHEEPIFEINFEWLENNYNKLWLQCMDTSVIEKFYELDQRGDFLHYFWHQSDMLSITNKGYILSYSGEHLINRCIAMFPEIHDQDISKCYGICSDKISNYTLIKQ